MFILVILLDNVMIKGIVVSRGIIHDYCWRVVSQVGASLLDADNPETMCLLPSNPRCDQEIDNIIDHRIFLVDSKY